MTSPHPGQPSNPNVMDCVEDVNTHARALSQSINTLFTRWVRFHKGSLHLLPASIDDLVDLCGQLQACLQVVRHDAMTTIRIADNDVVVLSSDDEGGESDMVVGDGEQVPGGQTNTDPTTSGENRTEHSSQEQSGVNLEERTCSICLDPIDHTQGVVFIKRCFHLFHVACLEQHRRSVSA